MSQRSLSQHAFENKITRSKKLFFFRYFGIPVVVDEDESDEIIDFLLEEATNGKVEVKMVFFIFLAFYCSLFFRYPMMF